MRWVPTTPPPLEVLEEALDVLDQHLFLSEVTGPTTHVSISAENLEHADVPRALGRYFVGVMAGAVDEDATLSEELLATTPDSAVEVRHNVLSVIGTTNRFPDKAARGFRDRVRNPWIAELVAHALLVLRARRETACLAGTPFALKQPHIDPRRQGLDLIGIYDSQGDPAAAIGEAKASRRYGKRRLNEAADFFSRIDKGKRGVEIRSELGALKHVLPAGLREKVADGYWRERRCYLPVVVFNDPIDEESDHDGLGALAPPVECRRLIALQLERFHPFFNDVADEIRTALDEVLP